MDLTKVTGIPMRFDGSIVRFGAGTVSEPVRVRTLEEARPYLMEPHAKARRKNLYLMYRDAHRTADEALFKKHGIRFDITVLFPGTIGGNYGEYIKTIGHAHPAPELYEVLHGEALFVFQEMPPQRTARTFLVHARKGDKIIVPTGLGHVTVNTGTEALVLADLFSETVRSDYRMFERNHGATYWVRPPELTGKGLTLTKNPAYKGVGDVLIGIPDRLDEAGIPSRTPIYMSFLKDPEAFSFLTDPAKARKFLAKTSLFVFNWQGHLA